MEGRTNSGKNIRKMVGLKKKKFYLEFRLEVLGMIERVEAWDWCKPQTKKELLKALGDLSITLRDITK